MASARRYYDDGYTRAFTGRVAARGSWGGAPAVTLEETWFYPESGGQLGDRGLLGEAPVRDVQADDEGRVWHVLDDVPRADEVACVIDWERRFDHMQQHTGQHVLSAALERECGWATLSSTLGAERSVIEIATPEIDWRVLERVERAANRLLWDDREIRLHWTDAAGVGRFALRKPPKVDGAIRIVEIPDWDVSACGGTHTRRTGEVGVVKVTGWEKVRGNVRLGFLCGERALRDHAWRTESLLEAAKRRTLKDRDLLAHLERAADERDELAKQLRDLRERALAADARARVGDPPEAVAEWADSRSRDEVRGFALACLTAGAPWVVSAAGAPEPVVVVARAKSHVADLKAMLPGLLAAAGGKGGGSPEQLQVAAADAAAARRAYDLARESLAR